MVRNIIRVSKNKIIYNEAIDRSLYLSLIIKVEKNLDCKARI